LFATEQHDAAEALPATWVRTIRPSARGFAKSPPFAAASAIAELHILPQRDGLQPNHDKQL
jgi:hypothetical protein